MVVDAEVNRKNEPKTTLWSERSSLLKKRLTEPTLLEMSGTMCYLCLRPLTLSNLYANVVPAVATWLLLTVDRESAITTLPFSLTTTHSRLATAFGGYFRGKWIER